MLSQQNCGVSFATPNAKMCEVLAASQNASLNSTKLEMGVASTENKCLLFC